MSWMPCVNGKSFTTPCIASDMTSRGRVAPEKTSMGKYKMQATMLAYLASFATPPTIKPILNVNATARSQLPPKAKREPSILTSQITAAASAKVSRDAAVYKT